MRPLFPLFPPDAPGRRKGMRPLFPLFPFYGEAYKEHDLWVSRLGGPNQQVGLGMIFVDIVWESLHFETCFFH